MLFVFLIYRKNPQTTQCFSKPRNQMALKLSHPTSIIFHSQDTHENSFFYPWEKMVKWRMAPIRDGTTRRRCFLWCKREKPVKDSRYWRQINLYLFWISCFAAGFVLKAGLQYRHKAEIYFDNLISRYLFLKLLDS